VGGHGFLSGWGCDKFGGVWLTIISEQKKGLARCNGWPGRLTLLWFSLYKINSTLRTFDGGYRLICHKFGGAVNKGNRWMCSVFAA
jgi:hypothetical protein